MCGGSTLESTSKKASSAPAPVKAEKLNVAKVLGYGGVNYYVQYRDNGRKTDRIDAVKYIREGRTDWSSGGNFYFNNMSQGFQTLKTLPNALRKAS